MAPSAHANFIFRHCELDMDHASYLRYLISRHDKLNLPYSFAIKLSFLASPLVLGKAMLIHCEDTYRTIGACGFAYGTGPGEYEDRENCQIEIFYIEEDRRTPGLLLAAAIELMALIRAGNPDVKNVQFWVPAKPGANDTLLGRIARLPSASRTVVDALALYKLPIDELEDWVRGLGSRWETKRAV